MKRTVGSNAKVDIDGSGKAAYQVDWECPYCGNFNASFGFSDRESEMAGDFEIDKDCDSCGKTVTVECRNVEHSRLDQW